MVELWLALEGTVDGVSLDTLPIELLEGVRASNERAASVGDLERSLAARKRPGPIRRSGERTGRQPEESVNVPVEFLLESAHAR